MEQNKNITKPPVKNEWAAVFPRTAGVALILILLIDVSTRANTGGYFDFMNQSMIELCGQVMMGLAAVGVVAVVLGFLFDKRGYGKKVYIYLGLMNLIALISTMFV